MSIDSLFSEEHRLLRRTVRRFVAEELDPYVDEWEAEGIVPREIYRKMGELGFLGIRYPEAYGGLDADLVMSVAFAEELARCRSRGLTMGVLVHTDMASPYLVRYGTDAQMNRYLPGIISGEQICAVAITEPNAGSDVAGLETKAERDGDVYVLNGSKTFITNALIADLFFVAARTRPKGDHDGLSLFLVEKGTPGFQVEKKLEKLGMWASDTGELAFTDCRVPADNLIGEENCGFYQLMEGFQNERLMASVAMVSSAQQAIEDAIGYAQERELFGRKLSTYQATQHKLARMETELEAARQLIYHVVRRHEAGKPIVKQVTMAKALTAEVTCRVADECLQIHGGYGYIREYDIERFYRDIRLWKIGGGATEVMWEIIAKEMEI
ncbi:MAG: acyl-CoA dehydrogenase family protein [Candidatus Bipolaricaulia bacterium]